MIFTINLEYIVSKRARAYSTKYINFVTYLIHRMTMNFIKRSSIKFVCRPFNLFDFVLLVRLSLAFSALYWYNIVICPKWIFCAGITYIVHVLIPWFEDVLVNPSKSILFNIVILRFKFKHDMIFPNFRKWNESSS